MATQVPYSGAPQIGPGGQPTSPIHVDTPIAAFGGATAQAVATLGNTEEASGKELFDRAIALQQMHEAGVADERTAAFQNNGLVNRYLDLTGKQGQDAVNAFPGFLQQTEADRVAGGEGLSPYATQLYNQETRASRFRTVFSAGVYVKDQAKTYASEANKAVIASTTDLAIADPTNPAAVQAMIDGATARGGLEADQRGFATDSPERKEMVAGILSTQTAAWLHSLARKDPVAAEAKMHEAIQAGQLRGPDVGQTWDFIKERKDNVGARVDAHTAVYGTDLSPGAGIVAPEQAQIGIKAIEGGNYGIKGKEVTNAQGLSGHGLGAYQVMSYNLAPWLKEAGMPAMSEEAFLADRAAQDQLFNFKFGQYMSERGSFNKAAQAWFGGPGSHSLEDRDALGTSVAKYLSVANGALAAHQPLAAKVAHATDLAQAHSPDDPSYIDIVTSRTEALWAQGQRIAKDAAAGNINTVMTGIYEGDKDGKLPTNPDELRAMGPQYANAWDALDDTNKLKMQKAMAGIVKGDYSWDPAGKKRDDYNRLQGQILNGDPDSFNPQDIDKYKFPVAAANKLRDLWFKRQQRSGAAPDMTKVLQPLGKLLGDAGITPDSDNYDLFTGELQGVIEDWSVANKRPPDRNEIKDMATHLLQDQAMTFGQRIGSWLPWGSSPGKLFESEVPPEAAAIIRQSPIWKQRGYEPSPNMIKQIYNATEIYNQFYGKAKAKPIGAGGAASPGAVGGIPQWSQ